MTEGNETGWPATFVALDVETTGFVEQHVGRVIEIAAVPVEGFPKAKVGYAQAALLWPDAQADFFETASVKEAMAVNRITPMELAREGAPFQRVWSALAPVLQGQMVVMHNAAFDKAMIGKELEICGGHVRPWLARPALCTMTLDLLIGAADTTLSRKLSSVAERWGVTEPTHDFTSGPGRGETSFQLAIAYLPHRASGDACTVGRILLAMQAAGQLPNDEDALLKVQAVANMTWAEIRGKK